MEKQKFCILTSQRSGSTWLRELLNSHPSVVSFPELLISQKPHHNWSDNHLVLFYNYKKTHKQLRPFSLFNYINLLDNYPGNHSTIGFKLMYDQVLLHPEIVIKLISSRFKIIHLVRRNYIDVLISTINMKEKRIVQARSKIAIDKVKLNPNTLIFNLYKQNFFVHLFKNLLILAPNQVLNITYESLYNNLDETLLSVSNFLGLETEISTLHTDLQKINPGNLQDKISNYNEIKNILSGSHFNYLLESNVVSEEF